jgi:ABC-type branched-subunit amino acid transport system substrate-binding protein
VVYTSYPSPTTTDFSVELQEIENRGVHLIVHVFSAKAGQIFTTQWGERPKKAIPIGVNVLGQENSHWDITEGKCEYEIVASTPPRIPVNERVVPFWDRYVEMWGEDPIYTAFGTYDAMTILTAAIERAGTFDADAYPETDYVGGENRTRGRLIKELEETDMEIVMGRFKFDTQHDVFVEATKDPPGTGAYWYTEQDKRDLPAEDIFYVTWLSSEYVVPLLIQWQNGERTIVFPLNQNYTSEIQFPPDMYP